jgi:hypothetical protein
MIWQQKGFSWTNGLLSGLLKAQSYNQHCNEGNEYGRQVETHGENIMMEL